MFDVWLMCDDGLVYPNNIIKIKVQQNMGAFLDAISLNCHSNEDNNMVHVTWSQHVYGPIKNMFHISLFLTHIFYM